MAIPSINGQEINSSNAYQFYYGICHGDYPGIDKNSPQAKWCENFLSQDQITYCTETDEQVKDKGREKIDADGANNQKAEHGTGNDVMAVTAGAVGGASCVQTVPEIITMIKNSESPCKFSPWIAAAIGLVMSITAALSIPAINKLDPNKDARLTSEGKSEDDISQINATTQMMKEHQDSLEADAAEYEAQQAMLLDMRSENTNTLAGMQIEMNDALAAGDKDKVAELEASMSELEAIEFDTSGMDDIKMRSQDYEKAGLEADGLNESGTSVAKFLNEGKKLNADYITCGIGYGIAAIGSAACAVFSFLGIKWVADVIPASAAAVLFAGAAVCFGVSAGIAFKGAGDENKCATAGEKYTDPLESLSTEKGNLSDKIGSTEEGFEASDGAAAETMVEVDKAAEGAVAENTGTTPGGTPVSTGSSSGSSSGSTNA